MSEVYLDMRFKINVHKSSSCDNELEIAIDMGEVISRELKENSIINVRDIEVIGCGKINPLYFTIDECMLQELNDKGVIKNERL